MYPSNLQIDSQGNCMVCGCKIKNTSIQCPSCINKYIQSQLGQQGAGIIVQLQKEIKELKEEVRRLKKELSYHRACMPLTDIWR